MQYDQLKKRKAFIDQYMKEAIFEGNPLEFEDSRYVMSKRAFPTLLSLWESFWRTATDVLRIQVGRDGFD